MNDAPINLILHDLKDGLVSMQKDLIDLTYPRLKIIALTYAKDKNDWEDILSEAYYKAFRYIGSYDCSQNGYNWLCKIVQNVAYNFNEKANFCVSLDSAVEVDALTATEAVLIDKNALLLEMQRLSKEDRRLLYVKFWENRTYREIAKMLNSNKTTVHKRVMQIIQILKKNLQDEETEDPIK